MKTTDFWITTDAHILSTWHQVLITEHDNKRLGLDRDQLRFVCKTTDLTSTGCNQEDTITSAIILIEKNYNSPTTSFTRYYGNVPFSSHVRLQKNKTPPPIYAGICSELSVASHSRISGPISLEHCTLCNTDYEGDNTLRDVTPTGQYHGHTLVSMHTSHGSPDPRASDRGRAHDTITWYYYS